MVMVFNATSNTISVILVEETEVLRKSNRPDKLLSYNVVSSTPRHERDSNAHL